MALDYTLKTQKERLECVRETIAATSQEKLDANYLRVMTDICFLPQTEIKPKRKRKKNAVLLQRIEKQP